MRIEAAITDIKNSLADSVQLIAISKTKPIEDIEIAYNAGQRLFGENKAQEMRVKHEALPKDIEWHFIGHLQSNKIKYIAPYVALIHSIDSLNLLNEINNAAKKNNRVINCLLQFHIAKEDTKFGLNQEKAEEFLNSDAYKAMANVNIVGVMGMATFTDDLELIRSEFICLRQCFEKLKNGLFAAKEDFTEISMGMSDDYGIAIEEGSTLIRVGSSIFGDRERK